MWACIRRLGLEMFVDRPILKSLLHPEFHNATILCSRDIWHVAVRWVGQSWRSEMQIRCPHTFFSFNYNQLKANSKIRVDCVLWGDGNASGIVRTDLLYDGSIAQVGRTAYQYLSQIYVHCIFGHYFFNGASTTGNKAVVFKQDIENSETGRPFVTWNPNSTDDGRMGQLTSYLTITEYDL